MRAQREDIPSLNFLVWSDAESRDEWIEISNVVSDLPVIHTVGWVLHEDNEKIVLAMQKDLVNDMASMIMTIPKSWILRREQLKGPSKTS